MPEQFSFNAAWGIKGPQVNTSKPSLLGRKDTEIPTLIRHSENTQKTTAEHILLSGAGPVNLVSVTRLPATRIAKYVALSIINCNLQIEKEHDLKPTFDKLYPFVLDYTASREFQNEVNNIKKEVATICDKNLQDIKNNNILPELREWKTLHNTVETNYKTYKENINPAKTSEQYFKDIMYDRIYMNKIENYIISDLEPKLVNHAKEQGFTELTARTDDRVTYCFYGAPASGKGTTVALRRKEALEEGLNWSDTVKINTDTHRDFIMLSEKLDTPEIANRSALNHAEAGFISNMSYRLYEKKVNEKKAPNMLIDTPMITQFHIDLATKNNGRMTADAVTIPAELCVERAYMRGLEEGRQVPTEYLINSNKMFAENFHNVLADNVGKNIEYKLFDNNVQRGDAPILIEEGNLNKNIITTHRSELLENFLKKQNLNIKAIAEEGLYPANYHSRKPENKIHGRTTAIKVQYLDKDPMLQSKEVWKDAMTKIKEVKRTLSSPAASPTHKKPASLTL